MLHLVALLKKHWFLLGIVLVIVAARVWPWLGATGGPIHPEITVKYGAVGFIFFSSGIGLRTEDLTKAVTRVQLHCYIQTFSLLLVPCLLAGVAGLLSQSPMDDLLLNGLVVVGCMPPPVSSAVILTKAAGGNEAGAIFNSAFGSFLGIVITPAWLLTLLGSSGDVPFRLVFVQLSATVVLPLLVGQFVRARYLSLIRSLGIPFSTLSSATLLLIIYTTFCDTFSQSDVDIDEVSLLSIILLVALVQCVLSLSTFWLASSCRRTFTPADVVACLFCTTHKSLTLGIPILRIMYAGDPQLSVLSLPLLIYHPMQILLGGVMVPTVRAWMLHAQRLRTRYPGTYAARHV